MVRRPEHRPVQTDEKDRRHQQRGGVMEDKDVRRIVKDLRRATKWLKVVEDLVADRLTKADRKSLASAIRRADQSLMKAGVGEEE